MLKLITSGEFSEFTIHGLVDVPSDFDIKAEFDKFLASRKVPLDWRNGRRERLAELNQELQGNLVTRVCEEDLLVPWLKSLGYPEVQFDSFNATTDDIV